MKILRFLGIVLGLVLVVFLVRQVGWVSIRETLELLGWKYLIILAYPSIWIVFNTVGWRYALQPKSASVSLRTLIEVRLAGETFNSLLPSSYVGGEPVKAKLLSRWIPLHEAASSVLIAKAAQSIGLLFYIGLGLALGIPATATSSQRLKAWIALGVLTVGVAVFTVLLANQSFSRFGRMLHRLTRLPGRQAGWYWLQKQEARLIALDESLGTFYRECKGRFLASSLWHGAGWVAGLFELVVIFALMGHPISWHAAWFMGALAQLGAVIGLISPGGLGFYEGGHYMAAVLLGLPPELGVSASLIRRVREIFWDAVGLYFFSKYTRHTTETENRQ